MERITIIRNNMPQIGLFIRTATQGKELALVQAFIQYYCDRFLQNSRKCNLAVFIEPRITSGFPDIVFASYLPSIMENWSPERTKLNVNDLKMLSHLLLTQGSDSERLMSTLKLPKRQTTVSLEKLLDAKLISYCDKNWHPRKLRDVFSIKKLVSVEAKINNINRAVDQSLVNTWFSSHSYVLTNVASPRYKTLNTFLTHGIGLYCEEEKFFRKTVEAKKIAVPSTYLSLQFNEWIGNIFAAQRSISSMSD